MFNWPPMKIGILQCRTRVSQMEMQYERVNNNERIGCVSACWMLGSWVSIVSEEAPKWSSESSEAVVYLIGRDCVSLMCFLQGYYQVSYEQNVVGKKRYTRLTA